MNFKIDTNKEVTIPRLILLLGYIVSLFAFCLLVIEYIRLDFTAEALRFLSVGIFIVCVGAYLNGKEK